MNCFEVLMLILMLALGAYCSYTDFICGKVSNKVLIGGFSAGLILHVCLLFSGMLPYYRTWIINMLVADFISIGMYYLDIWAAGDSKLFMALYFLVPPRLLDAGPLSYSIMPFLFIFSLALLWTMCDTTFRLLRREAHKKQTFEIKTFLLNYARNMIEVTGFYSVCYAVNPDKMNTQPLFASVLLFLYVYFCSHVPLMKKWYIVVIHLGVAIALGIVQHRLPELPSIWNIVIIAAVIIIQKYCSMYNYQLIRTSEAKEGIIPAMETVMSFQKSRVHSLPADPSEKMTARITCEQAAAIRRWEKSATGKPEIWIVRKVPFAVMILMGFIFWMSIRIGG